MRLREFVRRRRIKKSQEEQLDELSFLGSPCGRGRLSQLVGDAGYLRLKK